MRWPSLSSMICHARCQINIRQTPCSSFLSHISQSACVNNHQPKAIKTWHFQSHGLGISVMMGSWHLKREGDLTLGFVPPNPRLIALQGSERFGWIHLSYLWQLGFVSLICGFFYFFFPYGIHHRDSLKQLFLKKSCPLRLNNFWKGLSLLF